MSSQVLSAQNLPSNVLYKVLDYATRVVVFPSVDYSPVIKECLSVSFAWRQAALEYMWRELKLDIDNEGNSIYFNRYKWAKNFKLPSNAAALVRSLSIHLPMSAIVNGRAQELLQEYMGETTHLPLALKLAVTVNDHPQELELPADTANSNTLEFAQLLSSLVQSPTTTTKIWYVGADSGSAKLIIDAFGVLVNSLSSNTKHCAVDVRAVDTRFSSAIENISMISTLDVNCMARLGFQTQLVHKCANTLKALGIRINDPKTMFYDINGDDVAYPNLEQLQLMSYIPEHPSRRPLAPSIVPFPELRILKVLLEYPFGDDVLFRGNNATLENLAIWTDRTTVNMLNSSPAFGRKFNNLRKVAIHDDYSDGDLSLVPEDLMAKFLGKLAGSACSLKLVSPISVGSLLSLVQLKNGCDNIQVFEATLLTLTVFDTLFVIKALPALAKLTCGLDSLGAELEHIAAEELPDHIASTYCAVGKQLTTLTISFDRGIKSNTAVSYIMFLALACPKLRRITIQKDTIPDYYTRVAEMLESGPFSTYASQLNRLRNDVY